MKASTLLVVTLLSGCALAPVSAPIEITHVSHLTQHFERLKTDFGYDTVNVGLKWAPSPGLSIKIEEGIGLDSESHINTRYYGNQPAFGALLGPREVFTGSITYEIPLR